MTEVVGLSSDPWHVVSWLLHLKKTVKFQREC